jgi:cell division protease FtsH
VRPKVAVQYGAPTPALKSEPLDDFLSRWADAGFDAAPPSADLYFTEQGEQGPVELAVVLVRNLTGDARRIAFTAVPVKDSDVDAAGRTQPTSSALKTRAIDNVRLSMSGGVPAVPQRGTIERIRDGLNEWSAILGILFMALLVFIIWRSIKMIPRTAPQTLKPAARTAVTWEEVAGADDAKEELMEVVQFLRDPKKFRRFGATMPKGVLLHGPPGTGKTLLAKAVAHESGAHFFSQSAASFVEMFAGLGAARIRRLFAEARKHSPAIIFIDELDAVGGKRGDGVENSEREQTLNQLLVEMDGFAAAEDVVVMAASNLLDKLDPALLRPGRFDRQVFVAPPDVAGREEILEVHARGKPLHDVDLRTIAAQTSGLTGADLANLCNEAAIFCARRDGVAITQADFDMALERVIAGVQSKRVLQPAEKRVVAYHEAGHALCAEMLPSVDKVHKISIVPRGKALGFTLNLPEEDRYLKTRDELLDHIAMLLGGRVAEHVVFGKITTGASDDLKRVSDLTYAMVHEYAMGTADPAQAAHRTLAERHLASDVTRRIRDEEQRELAYEAQAMAERLITEHRDQLDALAEALLAHEVLEREQIDEIMTGVKRRTDRPRMTGIPTVAPQGLPTVTAAEELPRRDT